MKKGRKFYASLLLFTAALCPLSGNPDFGTGPAKAAEATVSVPRELLATVKSGYVKLNWTKTAGADHYFIYRKAGSGSYKKLATVKGSCDFLDRPYGSRRREIHLCRFRCKKRKSKQT